MRAKLIVASMVGLVACGGRIADLPDEPTTGAGPGGGGTSAISSSSGSAPRDAGVTTKPDAGATTKPDAGARRSAGRCAKDTDCAPGGRCVELAPGGYRVCSYPPPPPQPCSGDPTRPDQCCGTCASGTCTLETSCGGAAINPHNVCAVPACTVNADCGAKGVCLPTGVGSPYARTCLSSNECVRHADCVAAPDGVCALIGMTGPLPECGPWMCPGGPGTQLAYRLACLYGSDCAGDEDCPKGHCEKIGGRLACQPNLRMACPPPP